MRESNMMAEKSRCCALVVDSAPATCPAVSRPLGERRVRTSATPMAANTRVTRRSIANVPSALPDMTTLTNLDRLILAQAVYELGANSWSAVAKLLTKHPLLQRPKSFFTPQVSLVHIHIAFPSISHSILVMSGHVSASHERSRSRVRPGFLVAYPTTR